MQEDKFIRCPLFNHICEPNKCNLEEHDKQVIDEFFDNIKKYCKTSSCIGCRFCNDETCEIAVIKEQLKEEK